MAQKKPSKKKPAPKAAKFTAEERAAMKDRVRELESKGNGESEVLAKIASFKGADRALAERLHALVKTAAPSLKPKTWYGMPAYTKDDKVVCFFQSASRFKTRYATFGFSDKAKLDDGAMWPVGYALKDLGSAEEARIRALLAKAIA